VALLAVGSSLPIVICRYGGSSKRARTRERYTRRQANTSPIDQDIANGTCPNVVDKYKHLYTRDSVDSVSPKGDYSDIVGAILGVSFMLMASILVVMCIIVLVTETCSRIAKYVFFVIRPDH
jgi:hypothetical protein